MAKRSHTEPTGNGIAKDANDLANKMVAGDVSLAIDGRTLLATRRDRMSVAELADLQAQLDHLMAQGRIKAERRADKRGRLVTWYEVP